MFSVLICLLDARLDAAYTIRSNNESFKVYADITNVLVLLLSVVIYLNRYITVPDTVTNARW